MVDPIAVTAGLVQTALYLDFFYVYFTKCVVHPFRVLQAWRTHRTCVMAVTGCCRDKSSSYLHDRIVISEYNVLPLLSPHDWLPPQVSETKRRNRV